MHGNISLKKNLEDITILNITILIKEICISFVYIVN